ncbi:MAG: hypothetical protein WCE58_11955, partial [Gallionella sp.]
MRNGFFRPLQSGSRTRRRWPATSLWLVGLYVGISLLFDGWARVAIGWMCCARASHHDKLFRCSTGGRSAFEPECVALS